MGLDAVLGRAGYVVPDRNVLLLETEERSYNQRNETEEENKDKRKKRMRSIMGSGKELWNNDLTQLSTQSWAAS